MFHLSVIVIPGAEWWAQDVGKSIPLLGWVPFIDGIIVSLVLLRVFNRAHTNKQNVPKFDLSCYLN